MAADARSARPALERGGWRVAALPLEKNNNFMVAQRAPPLERGGWRVAALPLEEGASMVARRGPALERGGWRVAALPLEEGESDGSQARAPRSSAAAGAWLR